MVKVLKPTGIKDITKREVYMGDLLFIPYGTNMAIAWMTRTSASGNYLATSGNVKEDDPKTFQVVLNHRYGWMSADSDTNTRKAKKLRGDCIIHDNKLAACAIANDLFDKIEVVERTYTDMNKMYQSATWTDKVLETHDVRK